MPNSLYFYTEIFTIMKDTIAWQPKLLMQMTTDNPDVFCTDIFALFYDMRRLLSTSLREKLSTPQYIPKGRLIRVTIGQAVYRINMWAYELQQGDIFIIPEHTYIEFVSASDDFNAQVVSFYSLPISFSKCTQMHLSESDFARMGDYISLIWNILHKPSFSMQTIEYLLSAMMSDLHNMQEQLPDKQINQSPTRSEQIFHDFMELVAEHGSTERNVLFYAERLLLTPNHLSAIVRKQSGQTVMYWTTQRTILQAKILLHHSDLPIGEIAYDLGFTEPTLFSRFFMRELGVTPMQYRKEK